MHGGSSYSTASTLRHLPALGLGDATRNDGIKLTQTNDHKAPAFMAFPLPVINIHLFFTTSPPPLLQQHRL